MQRTTVNFNEPLFDKLGKHSEETGLSQSEIVRRALELYFAQQEEK